MAVLVTGADGFVGRHFLTEIGGVPLQLDGINVDLRDHDAVCAAISDIGPSEVVHLAAQSFVPSSFEDPLFTFQVNFIGTYNLLAALKVERFAGRFLYVSTGDLYGRVDEVLLPVSEDYPIRPRNPYSVSKAAAEALCYQWSQTENFDVVIARPFNHVGPNQSDRFVIPSIARQLLLQKANDKPALHLGDIDVTRDYTDVRDVVRAYRVLLDHGRSGEFYNVCSSVERSVRNIIDAFASIIGRPITVELDQARVRPAEQRRMVGDNRKIRALGWEPEIPWKTTLSDTLASLAVSIPD